MCCMNVKLFMQLVLVLGYKLQHDKHKHEIKLKTFAFKHLCIDPSRDFSELLTA